MSEKLTQDKEFPMSPNTKIELAREILNAMIAHYGKNGYDPTNKMLMESYAAEKAMCAFDFDAIDKIIDVYGPMVKKGFK